MQPVGEHRKRLRSDGRGGGHGTARKAQRLFSIPERLSRCARLRRQVRHTDRAPALMARRTSRMLPLGTPAPPFALRDTVTDRTISLESFASSPALLVAFIC